MEEEQINNVKWLDGWMQNHSPSIGSGDYLNISQEKQENREKIRVVCCSDTHGNHRDIEIPRGDIFIHAGDFTRFGKLEDAIDFNNWLGDDHIFGDFKLKVVVNGNHENNAPWKDEIRNILSNATFLKNDWCTYTMSSQTSKNVNDQNTNSLKIYGTNFFWPMKTRNPYYDGIPDDIDVLVSHGPIDGYVDGHRGCPVLLNRIEKINASRSRRPIDSFWIDIQRLILIFIQFVMIILFSPTTVVFKMAFSRFSCWPETFRNNIRDMQRNIGIKFVDFLNSCSRIYLQIQKCFFNSSLSVGKKADSIRLVVSGHIHEAHGIARMDSRIGGYTRTKTTFVNAAIANNEYGVGFKPIVIDL